MTRQALFAVAMVIAMVGAPLTGAVAADSAGNATGNLSVGVAQDDDGETTVSVTRNDTGVVNASVLVETADNDTYDGAGDYATDDDGEIELPAPAENVTVSVTAEEGTETATTTAELDAAEENETDAFGKRVSAYVLALHNDQNVTRIGPLVAAFVTAENPGNAPDHAGPPTVVTGDDADDDSNERGAPAHAGPPSDAGPPEDRGDDDEDDAEDEEEDDAEDGERGPSEGAGPPDNAGK